MTGDPRAYSDVRRARQIELEPVLAACWLLEPGKVPHVLEAAGVTPASFAGHELVGPAYIGGPLAGEAARLDGQRTGWSIVDSRDTNWRLEALTRHQDPAGRSGKTP